MSGRRATIGAAAGVAVVVLVVAAVLVGGDGRGSAATGTPDPQTARVERGPLSASVSQTGTLTYRAGRGGAPYVVTGAARGTYTELPTGGPTIRCGDPLYRVDDRPVVLLCGPIPAYRDLRPGDEGRDVRQLNRALHAMGSDRRAGVRVDPASDRFTETTSRALRAFAGARGLRASTALRRTGVVVLPEPIRIAKVDAQLGGSARPGSPVLTATSARLHVEVALDPSNQGAVRRGDRVRITLPAGEVTTGSVAGFGRVATTPQDGGDDGPADATIPTYVALDDPVKVRGLDEAPVQVDITTGGVRDALSVPVTALVGRAGGGFAVEVVQAGGARSLVPVTVGLFDTGGGRVEVAGAMRAGDRVVVPSL